MEIISSKNPSSIHQLPPGFRFHPSDEELIVHYLKNKLTSNLLPASVIADIDLYKYNPWELPKKASFGEDEWYFFTPRDRKYPKGARPNRAAGCGFWKATGTDKHILNSGGTASIGVKKALVFYRGRPPRGIKTDWIMHEYRLLDSMLWNPKRKGCMRLDDWVLCRVRQKSSRTARSNWEDRNGRYELAAGSFPAKANEFLEAKPDVIPNMEEMIRSYLYNDCPMLPYLLASQDFPCNETTSTISFQSSDRSSITSVFKDEEDDPNLFNPLKRKLMEKTDHLASSNKKLMKGDDETEDVMSISQEETVANYCGSIVAQSENNSNFSPETQWNCVMQFQDQLNQLALSYASDGKL